MEYLSNDHEYHPRLQENSHKLYGEKGHPLLNLKKGQWKWRQQHDQSFSNGGKSTVEQILTLEERNKFTTATLLCKLPLYFYLLMKKPHSRYFQISSVSLLLGSKVQP